MNTLSERETVSSALTVNRVSPKLLVITNMFPTKCRPFSGTFIEQQVEGLRRIGLTVEVLLFDRLKYGRLVYGRVAEEVGAKIDEFSPDLVHVMYGGVLAYKVAMLRPPIPFVVSFCGEDLYGTPGNRNLLRNWINIRASHYAAKSAAGIIVKSKNLRAALPARLTRGRPLQIIPNGVDLRRFKRLPKEECLERVGWDRDKFHVVFCRNGSPVRKREWLARDAFACFHKHVRNSQFHVLDKVPHECVPSWLGAADALIVTSINEGSINIVKEALACGLAIVSVDVGDVKERVDGIEGCHVVQPDSEALARALASVASSRKRINANRSLDALSIESIARRLDQFYRLVAVQGKSASEDTVSKQPR